MEILNNQNTIAGITAQAVPPPSAAAPPPTSPTLLMGWRLLSGSSNTTVQLSADNSG